MASLFVIEGADQGRRIEVPASRVIALGRDGSNFVRLHDNEVSRRHAELRPEEDKGFRFVDLGSANGSFINGQQVEQARLQNGDQLRLGRTVLLFNMAPSTSGRDLTERVDLLSKASPEDRSAIIRSIPATEGSRALEAPGSVGDWLKVRLANLGVMYQATQAVSHILDPEELLPRILQLVFDSVGADRAAILVADDAGKLVPKVVRWKGDAEPNERMTISQTIVEHVRETGQGVITTDAPGDQRFQAGESIVDYGIREALCVPVQGRHTTLGVLYADIRAGNPFAKAGEGSGSARTKPQGKFSNEHLMLMVAIGHQAGLAMESTRFYQAKLQAERLAAIGQTIATLSHHIKNILQGLRGGSAVIELGLKDHNEEILRRGWTILEKNQTKIYNLVMDMLSYSKDREPSLEAADLNDTVGEVVELMRGRAEELGVALVFEPAERAPEVQVDPDGIHRAVLNLVTNGLDAAENESGTGRVSVRTSYDEEKATAYIEVSDNGPGVPEEDLPHLFQLFGSTKGARGTGLGLPVSRKIVREHGGELRVVSTPGAGARFTIELPQRRS